MSIERITPAQWQTQRWQNGGGITHQLCRQDDQHGMLWRLSIAEVATDGPFSRFDNIDRIIMLLEGNGFYLQGVVDSPKVLDTPLTPFAFAGEAPIHCALINGAVRDFNLMTRRAAVTPQLQVLSIGSEVQTVALSAQTLIYVASGNVEIALEQQTVTLAAQHTLSLANKSGGVQISSSAGAKVVFIGLSFTSD